ncbi:MAG: hypothetical protein HQL22_01095 [Candidatus Omnitrophica bacterium]|nr:hypothetical protein [Candidatus Omnitrophota bacterium]
MDKEKKLYALLSYCSLLCLVPLLKMKDDEFLLFHGRQGLALFLCEMAIFVVSIILPWLMKIFLFVFGLLSFLGMVKALCGEKYKLPFIFPLSERLVL